MCWCSGALVLDGCTYFMPYNARRILKFDPEEESTANVGERLGDQHDAMEMNKYNEDTVLGNNGWLYGIPYGSNRIVRFNPADHATSTVGEAITNYLCCKGGVLGRDGFIYGVDDHDGRVLKIDVVNNSYSFVGGNPRVGHIVFSLHVVIWARQLRLLEYAIQDITSRKSRCTSRHKHKITDLYKSALYFIELF